MPVKTPTKPPRTRGPVPSTSATQVDPATGVMRRFRTVVNAVKTHCQQVEKEDAGVGGAQLWALSVIQAHPGVVDLAKAMDIHQTTVSALVRAMVVAGQVISNRDGPARIGAPRNCV